MSTAAGTAPANPFPGLRPFREDEAHLFFGRERQIDRMIDKLRPGRFLAIVGTSGSGKSSLVNCGLRPALHRGRMPEAGSSWRFSQFRPANNPIGALAQSLAEPGVLFSPQPGEDSDLKLDEIIDANLRISTLGLVDVYQQAYPRGDMNLLVVVDQFEELFRYRKLATEGADPQRYGPSEESIAFVKLLLEASSQRDYPIYVALTARSDFLGDCAQLEGLPEAINEGQYLVPRMTRSERRMAIEGPVAVGGRRIDPVLLTRLVNEVGDNPDQLSILQHALNRTWARAGHDVEAGGELRPSHYDDIGSMARALDRHADKAWKELTTPRQQEICEKMFRALTDTGSDPRGIRRPTRLGSLCALTGATQEEIVEVLAVFRKPSRSFLMPPLPTPPAVDALSPDTVIDISHESLMRVWEKLRGWADKEARAARLYRRVSETAALYNDGRKAGLIRDRELENLLAWWDKEEPNEEWARQYQGNWKATESFIEESRGAQQRDTAEKILDRQWGRIWRPILLVVLFALCLYPLGLVGRKTFGNFSQVAAASRDAAAAGAQPNLPLSAVLGPLVSLCLTFTALLGGSAGIVWAGRRVHRALAFDGILHEVTSRRAEDNDPARQANESEASTLVYAPFGRRLAAGAIDFIACVVIAILVGVGTIYVLDQVSSLGGDASVFEIFGAILLSQWLYEALLTSSRWQGTLGMLALRIMAADISGGRLTFARASGRHFAKLSCWLTCYLGFLTQAFTPRKQCLNELIAGCVTIARPPRASRVAGA